VRTFPLVVKNLENSLEKSGSSSESGFTLLEILMSVGILASISVFAITSLSNQLEMRNRLAIINESQHGLHTAMSRIFDDVRHAYVLTKKDLVISGMSQNPVKPRLAGKAEAIWFSTHAIRSFARNSPQSNIGFVRYTVVTDPADSSKKQLLRALDQDFKESIERENVGNTQILVRDLKEFKVTYWNGQDFTPEWDTDSSDTSGRLPKMVKIAMSAFEPLPEDVQQKQDLDPNKNKERKVLSLETIVYLLFSAGQKDVKDPPKEYKWQ
jgi:general secretion pathway protein J